MSEFDTMKETNEKIYDIINQDDWNFDCSREMEIQDADREKFKRHDMQYWRRTTINGVYVRTAMRIDDGKQQKDKRINK